jgi:hypothetical protein
VRFIHDLLDDTPLWVTIPFVLVVVLFVAVLIAVLISTAYKAGKPRCPACREILNKGAAKCHHCGERV